MHSLDVASVERWLHAFKNLNTRSSYWKRLAQFFDFLRAESLHGGELAGALEETEPEASQR